MNRSLVLVGTLALVLPLRQIGAAQSDRTLERVGRTGGRRIALCIGNDAYPGVPLRNAVNDARAIAGELTSAGFVVDLRLDVGREAAERAIDSFIGKLGTAEVGFFYYAGHGIQIAGENYLLPVDFDAQDEIQAKYRSYNTEQLRERMESAGSRVNVIVLDACRDNPYKLTRSGSRGWGPMNAGRGTLIALATGPGQTASDNVKEGNGLFTQHLVAAMREPGLRVQEVFDRAKEAVSEASGQRQRPWIHSDITGVVYLRPPQGATLPAGQAGPGLALDAAVVELEYWRGVQSIGTLDAYRGYKARYPSGQFADLANLQIQRLSAPVAPGRIRGPCSLRNPFGHLTGPPARARRFRRRSPPRRSSSPRKRGCTGRSATTESGTSFEGSSGPAAIPTWRRPATSTRPHIWSRRPRRTRSTRPLADPVPRRTADECTSCWASRMRSRRTSAPRRSPGRPRCGLTATGPG
jgi:hypothetical protein